MKRLSASDIVLKVLGLLLLAAAVLKGHELLTVPTANKDLWSWRPFLIFQVEFELAMAIWLLSGLFKPLAWLASLACFGLFCGVTLYKGLTGAASCGCFGTVHVSPWITLFAIDLPALAGLGLFRPRTAFAPSLSFLRRRKCISGVLGGLFKPLPPLRRFAAAAALGAAILGVTTPILALNEPAVVTSSYEVLEPETWVGKRLPILEYIDIAEQLKRGTWLVLFYHYDCPDCQKAIPQYEQMVHDLAGREDFLRIALVEVPPYGQTAASPCVLGHLVDVKEWFVTTPVAVLLGNTIVRATWENLPNLDTVLIHADRLTCRYRTAGESRTGIVMARNGVTLEQLGAKGDINPARRALDSGVQGRNRVSRCVVVPIRVSWNHEVAATDIFTLSSMEDL